MKHLASTPTFPDNPNVSVIITNFNYAKFLPKAIDSVLSQTYQNIEIIVIDDGSTDNSLEVLSKYSDKITTHYKKNNGQASAFNAGVLLSQGEILCFLDADDYWFPDKVYEIVKKFKKGSWGMVFHDLTIINNSSKNRDVSYTTTKGRIPPQGSYFPEILKENYSACFIPTSGISISKNVANVIFPLHEPGWEICADNQLTFCGSCVDQVGYINKQLGTYIIHGENLYSAGAEANSDKNLVRGIMNKLLCFLKHEELSLRLNIELFSPLDSYCFHRRYLLTTHTLEFSLLSKLLKINFNRINKNGSLHLYSNFLKYVIIDTILYLFLLMNIPCRRKRLRDYFSSHFFTDFHRLIQLIENKHSTLFTHDKNPIDTNNKGK